MLTAVAFSFRHQKWFDQNASKSLKEQFVLVSTIVNMMWFIYIVQLLPDFGTKNT